MSETYIGVDMIWVKLLRLVVLLLLVKKSPAQYKYVFYDGDEADYYGSEVNSCT